MAFLLLWAASATGSALLFTLSSLAIDRRVFFSTWVVGALVVTVLFGPLGTLLVLWFLIDTAIVSFKKRGCKVRGEDRSPRSLISQPVSGRLP